MAYWDYGNGVYYVKQGTPGTEEANQTGWDIKEIVVIEGEKGHNLMAMTPVINSEQVSAGGGSDIFDEVFMTVHSTDGFWLVFSCNEAD